MRVTRPLRVTGLLVSLSLSLSVASASADVGETIILRCTANKSLSGFSQSAYSKALKELSADTEEYSDCSSLIRQAQRAAAGHSGSSRSAGGETAGPAAAIAATPAETQAIARAAKVNPGPVQLDGSTVRPGVIHANVSSAFNSIPAPLLATVAFLLAGLLTLAGRTLRNRVRDGRAR